jgi:hypothetical protein|tara:strand:+ start:1229 stop:1429 length:201 start_codon:yes stop_codon:yes gene_type:complete
MKLDGTELAGAQNDMIYLIGGILMLGLLVYMIFLSNEMSDLIKKLQDKTKKLMNKLKKYEEDNDEV